MIFYIYFLLFSSFSFANNFNIVARVNDNYITEYDLKESKISLDMLISNMVKQKAIKDNNIEFVESEFEEYLSEYKKGNKNDYLWQKLIAKKIAPTINVSKKEIDDVLEYMGSNDFNIRYNISQITIHNNSMEDKKSIIDKLYKEIVENDNFNELAKTFSETNKEEAGEIGWIEAKEMNRAILEAIENLKIGQTSEPVFINNTYMLIKLNNKDKSKNIKNEDIYRAKKIVFDRKLTNETNRYYNLLEQNSLIEVKK